MCLVVCMKLCLGLIVLAVLVAGCGMPRSGGLSLNWALGTNSPASVK